MDCRIAADVAGFSFTSGYIEVSATLPGPNSGLRAYLIFDRHRFASLLMRVTQWPGIWTMGHLGRAGYPTTTGSVALPVSSEGVPPSPKSHATTADTTRVTSGRSRTPDICEPFEAYCRLAFRYVEARYSNELSWLPRKKLSYVCSDSS